MNIYLAGLGGIAMGPLALLCRDLGYEVFGSDSSKSRYTDIIEKSGITVGYNQDGSHLRQINDQHPLDWYVHTAAMGNDHPEVTAARNIGVKHIAKRDELINFILKERKLRLIAVSGTHGKTTTTAMIIWLLSKLDVPHAHLVGTNLSFAPSGFWQDGAEYLVYEADEYDRNMLRFRPYVSVITALDHDHTDTYPSPSDYKKAFVEFMQQSSQVVIKQHELDYLEIKPDNHFIIADKLPIPHSSLLIPGNHNRRNAQLAVKAVAELLQVQPDRLVSIINDYPGSERRFERVAENLYSDYAHHPEEIRATLQLAREVAGKQKIVAVYQPHQNVRQHEIAGKYQDCFRGADRLYWLPTYLSRENPELAVLPPEELLSRLTEAPEASVADLNGELASAIRQHLQDGDLVVVMGAGSVDEWLRQHFTFVDGRLQK